MCHLTNRSIVGIVIVLLLNLVPLSDVALGHDAMTLSEMCRSMETSILDITVEYEWHQVPPMTIEEITGPAGGIIKGPVKQKLMAKQPFLQRCLYTTEGTYVSKSGVCHEETNTVAYDGQIATSFKDAHFVSEDASRKVVLKGTITRSTHFLPSPFLTPLGFSVLRLSFSGERKALSERLANVEFVRIDNTPMTVNGFNTIRADLLQRPNEEAANTIPVDLLKQLDKRVYMRVYFSVDHGYTPVRYEHMSGREVGLTIDVNSLERVNNGLWFPSSGNARASDSARTEYFRAVKPIALNQGLEDTVLSVVFPPGTKVWDESADKRYVIKPTQEQLDEVLPKP